MIVAKDCIEDVPALLFGERATVGLRNVAIGTELITPVVFNHDQRKRTGVVRASAAIGAVARPKPLTSRVSHRRARVDFNIARTSTVGYLGGGVRNTSVVLIECASTAKKRKARDRLRNVSHVRRIEHRVQWMQSRTC